MTNQQVYRPIDWAEEATRDDARQLPAPASFVPARPRQYDLPALAGGSADQDTALMAAAAAAVSAGAGGVFEATSAKDRAIADGLRVGVYAAGFGVMVLALLCWLQTWDVAAAVFGVLGAGILIASALSHRASLRHSAPGVALAKLDTMRAMHKDTLSSRERIAATFAHAWLESVKTVEETERARVQHGRR